MTAPKPLTREARVKCPTCGYPFKTAMGQAAVEYHRAALVEVAKRTLLSLDGRPFIDCDGHKRTHHYEADRMAERVVAEYLAEQEGKS